MIKRSKRHQLSARRVPRTTVLPVDPSLFPDIISFGHVKGIARIFLGCEIVSSLAVVLGTLITAILWCVGFV